MGKGKFALGAIIGGAVGAAVGFLTAPKSGEETRADLKAKAEGVKKEALDRAENFTEEVNKRAHEAHERAEDAAGDLKEKADKLVSEAQATAEEVKTKAETSTAELKKTAADYKTRGENAARGAIDGAKKGFTKNPSKK